jgi:hypothetical protein
MAVSKDEVLNNLNEYSDWYQRVRQAIIIRRTEAGETLTASDINNMPWDKAKNAIMTWGVDYLPGMDTPNMEQKQQRGVKALNILHDKFSIKMYHTHYVNGKMYSHPISRSHDRSDFKTRLAHNAAVKKDLEVLLRKEPYLSLGIKKGAIFGFNFKYKEGRLVLRKKSKRKIRTKKKR